MLLKVTLARKVAFPDINMVYKSFIVEMLAVSVFCLCDQFAAKSLDDIVKAQSVYHPIIITFLHEQHIMKSFFIFKMKRSLLYFLILFV
ncbi:hypothetical protein AT238_01160 [Bartonella henselae]|nr:hypothetical protein AT238_01160 [Bartonella henselae]